MTRVIPDFKWLVGHTLLTGVFALFLYVIISVRNPNMFVKEK
jgi:hypothetical protein